MWNGDYINNRNSTGSVEEFEGVEFLMPWLWWLCKNGSGKKYCRCLLKSWFNMRDNSTGSTQEFFLLVCSSWDLNLFLLWFCNSWSQKKLIVKIFRKLQVLILYRKTKSYYSSSFVFDKNCSWRNRLWTFGWGGGGWGVVTI